MAAISIGALRYDIVANTEKFDKDLFATRKELNATKRVFMATQTPIEKYRTEMRGLRQLFRQHGDIRMHRRAVAALKQEYKETHSIVGGLSKRFRELGEMSKLALAGMGLAVAQRLIQQMRQDVQDMDKIIKQSRLVGMSAAELEAVRRTNELVAGMAPQTTDMAMQRFARRLQEAATGSGEAVKALRDLGIEARDYNRPGGTLDALLAVSDSMQAGAVSGRELATSFKLVDSEGARMANTLTDPRFREMLEEQRRQLGYLEENQEAVERLNDAWTMLGHTFADLRRQMAIDMGPALESISLIIRGISGAANRLRDSLKYLTGVRVNAAYPWLNPKVGLPGWMQGFFGGTAAGATGGAVSPGAGGGGSGAGGFAPAVRAQSREAWTALIQARSGTRSQEQRDRQEMLRELRRQTVALENLDDESRSGDRMEFA